MASRMAFNVTSIQFVIEIPNTRWTNLYDVFVFSGSKIHLFTRSFSHANLFNPKILRC